MEKISRVFLKKAECSLDLGDGSERGPYVNQDYIFQKMRKPHRGISLMYTYYPTDEGWPVRASVAFPQETPSGAWDYPYEDYFPYRGGVEGLHDEEPFKFMKDIRSHGQDVVLTMTINPLLSDEYIIAVAKDLRPYGRVLLRINHECTGTWFCFSRRADYQQVADFFVRCCKIFHKYSPNVKIIICAGMWEKSTGKIEMEETFLDAYREADYWSGDQYISLHWGWPADVALRDGKTFSNYDVEDVYEKAKNTWKRLCEITGQKKPMLLSELNADGDVSSPYGQAEKIKRFMELVQDDSEHWLDGFTMYQFRDDGRLGLEITDPNNGGVGIEQPLLSVYRKKFHEPFFSRSFATGEEISLPCKIRWGNADDSDGIEIPLHFNRNPHFAELYFDSPDLIDKNFVMELGGYWFYKKPGVKCVDLMSLFFERPLDGPSDLSLRIFAPPADGMNHPESGDPYEAPDGEWMESVYTEINSLPKIRIETEPVAE